jgi:hypothetical protein
MPLSGPSNNSQPTSSLGKFTEAINKKYRAQFDTRYEVFFHPPTVLPQEHINMVELYCASVSFPARNLLSSPIRLEEAPFEMPYGISYDPVTLTFYLDEKNLVRDYFTKWWKAIYSTEGHGISFFDDYVAPKITIYALNKMDQRKYDVTIVNAWPKMIGDVSFGASSGGNVSTIPITFAYEKMTEELVTS